MDYMNPNLPTDLEHIAIPVMDATDSSFSRFGRIVSDPENEKIEIVRWPATGWRPVDEDSGDEGGLTEGEFVCEWRGDVLYGVNEAVGGNYVLAYACAPHTAQQEHQHRPGKMLLWHANYHPDGGQMFFPKVQKEYYVPVAPPGDDVKPKDFVCFRFQPNQGCYLHPNIWHEGVFPAFGNHRFLDRQGKVHARVSVDFAREFECLLEIPLS